MALSSKPSPLWNVPYHRNKFFTERDDTLQILHRELQLQDAVALSQPQAITGLGGIGKTQMALEYAYRYGSTYAAVLWVQADSPASLVSSFVDLAHVLNLSERDEQDQNMIVEAVQRWLRLHADWLLIFDNMDDPGAAEQFVPKAISGHLLFTTRAQALNNIAWCVEIQPMKPDIGALLLLRRAEILALQATLEQADKEDSMLASEISGELDGLPLALDQAGAYIKAEACSLNDYLSLYRTRRQHLLQQRGSVDEKYPHSVATTWNISFDKVQHSRPAAAELLNFCAFLAPDAIPETIITKGAIHLGDVLGKVATDPVELDLTYREALKYSLIQREPDANIIAIHRLVQAVLRDNLAVESQQQWMQRTIPAVNASFPSIDFESWPLLERLLPHALICSTWIDQASITTRVAAQLLNSSGRYLKDRARYSEAEPLLKRAWVTNEQVLGPTHLDTAASMSTLATLYDNQGRYSEAELLFQRDLAICQQQLGTKHPDTARALNNLAIVYQHLTKYAAAEPLLQHALTICEQTLGSTHLDTARCLNSLAGLYQAQGKYPQAEALLQRALSIREQRLGSMHPDLARGLNNLAGLYEKQGKYEQAEALYMRALSIREQQLGDVHPDTAQSLNNIASLYQNQGKYELAEPFYKHALSIDEQVYGLDHPEVATDLNNLAELYKEQRQYEKAEPLHERALSIRERLVGTHSLSTAQSLSNLANLYHRQRKYKKAEAYYRRALEIREQQLGPQHPETAHSLNNLASMYGAQKKYREAEALFQRSLSICEQLYGSMHPKTAISLHNLAEIYSEQGKYTNVEPLYKRALFICEQALGREHPTTQIIRTSFNNFLQRWRT